MHSLDVMYQAILPFWQVQGQQEEGWFVGELGGEEVCVCLGCRIYITHATIVDMSIPPPLLAGVLDEYS